MIPERILVRKIAANYIYLPDMALVKNGYVILSKNKIEVVDTGEKITEIAGLEFYGGLIVPDFVQQYVDRFQINAKILPVLDRIYLEHRVDFNRIAIIEKVDLRELNWKRSAVVRLLTK